MRVHQQLPRFAASAVVLILMLHNAAAFGQQVPDQPSQPELSHRANKSPEARNTDPEGSDTTAKSTPMALGKADRAFMTQAATNGLFEVEASKLAVSHAQDPRIKALAQTLMRDHQKANEGLRSVALQHNYPLPDRLSKDKQAVIEQMWAAHGEAFDSIFVRQVGIAAHEEDIKAFKRASRATRTADLKDWIDRTLPILQAHLKKARDLNAR